MPENREQPSCDDRIKVGARSPDDTAADGENLPMTDEQAHRLKALAWQLGIPYDDSLSRAEAERRIAALRERM